MRGPLQRVRHFNTQCLGETTHNFGKDTQVDFEIFKATNYWTKLYELPFAHYTKSNVYVYICYFLHIQKQYNVINQRGHTVVYVYGRVIC